jgi:hypothetical protein
MSAVVKQRKTRVGECYLETREGHLAPEVTVANKMAGAYVWNKLYSPFL